MLAMVDQTPAGIQAPRVIVNDHRGQARSPKG